MLTEDDLKILLRPFALQEHSARDGGKGLTFAYIAEEAVAARIETVDPSWEFHPAQPFRQDKHAICTATMTIKGVTRGNTGMQKIDDEFGEAEKGATTDAFRRCARMFGISRYLLNAPNTRDEFPRWLAQQQKDYGMAAPAPQAPQDAIAPTSTVFDTQAFANRVVAPATGRVAIGPNEPNSKAWAVIKRDTLDIYKGNEFYQNASINKGLDSGWLTEEMTISEAIMAIGVHKREGLVLEAAFPRVESLFTNANKADKFIAFVNMAYRLRDDDHKITNIEDADSVVAQVQLSLMGELA